MHSRGLLLPQRVVEYPEESRAISDVIQDGSYLDDAMEPVRVHQRQAHRQLHEREL